MNTKLTFLLLSGFLLIQTVSPQGIILTSPQDPTAGLIEPGLDTIINNDTIVYCTADLGSVFEDGKITVINNTANPMAIIVTRFADESFCFTSNQFCWVQCYNPPTSVSPDSIVVAGYDSSTAFHGWVTPDGTEGCCFIKYRFTNQYDTTQFAEATIKYCFSNDCLAPDLSIDAADNSHMNIYPNPANESFNIELEPIENPAILRLTDQMGRVVREITVQPNQDIVSVQRDGLMTGIYFCNLYKYGKLVDIRRISFK